MELVLVGLAVAANIIIILWKFNNKRVKNAVLDTALLIAVGLTFAGSYSGLVVGTIGSFIVSLYLLLIPPKTPTYPTPAELAEWVDDKLR